MTAGLEMVSKLIVQSSIRQNLYAHRYESKKSGIDQKAFLSIRVKYRKALEDLYSLILKFQARCIIYYYSGAAKRMLVDIIKWNDWDAAIKEIEDENAAFKEVYELLKSTVSQEDFDAIYAKHEEATAIAKSTRDNVSDFKDQYALAQRGLVEKELLDWLSSVNPSTDYNSHVEKRGISSANWFLEDKDTLEWERKASSLLWLTGKGNPANNISLSMYCTNTDMAPKSALASLF